MNIRLTKPELERFVQEQVKAGKFASPDQVVEAGLAQLMLDSASQRLDNATLVAIESAEAQIERGEYCDWTEASADLRRRYLRK